jgi:hypothetical protein
MHGKFHRKLFSLSLIQYHSRSNGSTKANIQCHKTYSCTVSCTITKSKAYIHQILALAFAFTVFCFDLATLPVWIRLPVGNRDMNTELRRLSDSIGAARAPRGCSRCGKSPTLAVEATPAAAAAAVSESASGDRVYGKHDARAQCLDQPSITCTRLYLTHDIACGTLLLLVRSSPRQKSGNTHGTFARDTDPGVCCRVTLRSAP